jgi:hypothetical protein
VRIWEQELQRAPIGAQEYFFDLGGTSVKATRVFARIEERFHQRLALSSMIGAPNIEQLAASLLPGKARDRKAGRVGDMLQDQASTVAAWLGSQSKRRLHFVDERVHSMVGCWGVAPRALSRAFCHKCVRF